MNFLSLPALTISILSFSAEASASANDSTIFNDQKSAFSYSNKKISHPCFDDVESTKIIKNQKLPLLSLKSKEELSFKSILNKGSFNSNGKTYRIHINDSLEKMLKERNIQNEFLKTIVLLQKRVPGSNVEGYSFSWSNKKINASPFLGINAK